MRRKIGVELIWKHVLNTPDNIVDASEDIDT